ncbi:MAG: methanogen output domain 1-containing protein [Burkholderiaceae bacterium]
MLRCWPAREKATISNLLKIRFYWVLYREGFTMLDEPVMFNESTISRDRDQFLRELIHELAGVLEETVGLDEAEGFVAMVGNRIGEQMDMEYRSASNATVMSVEQLAAALVDLKRRIQGGFSIEHLDQTRITLVNTRCPFERHIEGRTSLCMMTSNVFGRIAANNTGYARVNLLQTIAKGDSRCRVVIDFDEGPDGREYFGQ